MEQLSQSHIPRQPRETRIRRGFQITNFRMPDVADADLFGRIAEMATTAESVGFDSLFLMDHFHQLKLVGGPKDPMPECYTFLSAIGARTSHIQVGAMIGGVSYRNPAYLAKVVTSLDIVTNGRAILGIGAGWLESEHIAYGYGFGTVSERFEMLEETLLIVKSMFVDDTTNFTGKWFQIHDALNFPKPIDGAPPILIGGRGKKKTLRLVAKYADVCNIYGRPELLRELLDTLDEHCSDLGRDPGTVWRTCLGTLILGTSHDEAIEKRAEWLATRGQRWEGMSESEQHDVDAVCIVGDADEVSERINEILAEGIDGIIVNLPVSGNLDMISQAGELLCRLVP
jgi:F420-dependent oxidoreductase-like protein